MEPPLADIADWILENKIVPAGVVIAIVVVWAVIKFVVPLILDRNPPPRASNEARVKGSGKVQQTATGDIKARGDVEINPRQE
jgi:hypothetical protein